MSKPDLIYVHVITNQIVCKNCANETMTGFMALADQARYNALLDRKVTCSICGLLR